MQEAPNSTGATVSLEQAVHELEETLIKRALLQACGSVYEASKLLGLRSEGALEFILRRHPALLEWCGQELSRQKAGRSKVVELRQWARRP
jgi:hypothetical protein